MQVDGLMHESPGASKDASHLENMMHQLPGEKQQEPTADVENELKAASDEESNSAESQLASKSEEESKSAENELNNASEEETVESMGRSSDEAKSEESTEEDTGDANEDQSDEESEQQAESPEEVGERSREPEEPLADFEGMEKRGSLNSAWGQVKMAEEEEEEFIEALLSLLERHPELANLLLKGKLMIPFLFPFSKKTHNLFENLLTC